MAIISQPADVHWNYFLSVEEDLKRLARFIEFNKQNYECFSIENTRILISAAAEAEVVCRQICKQINPNSKANNINGFCREIKPYYNIFSNFEVTIPRYALTLKPWDNWNNNKTPEWWTAYNKMKHERDSKYHLASLKNVLNSVAGLFVACLYLYKDKAEGASLYPSPDFLYPSDERYNGQSINSGHIKLFYTL